MPIFKSYFDLNYALPAVRGTGGTSKQGKQYFVKDDSGMGTQMIAWMHRTLARPASLIILDRAVVEVS